MTSPPASIRPIRSYVIRSGRLTESQRKAIEQHWDDYVIPFAPEVLPLESLFPNPGKLTIEIGFGMGDSLLEMAARQPDCNFIGIEVHRPGVGKLLHGIVEQGLNNLKIVCHDATEVMEKCFKPASIDRILIFFPDPWHKKRHNKRRIVQPHFVELMTSRLVSGGCIHLATDWENYAEQMLEVMENAEGLSNHNGSKQFWKEPQRPATKFERRGQRLGHGVWDLLYDKTS